MEPHDFLVACHVSSICVETIFTVNLSILIFLLLNTNEFILSSTAGMYHNLCLSLSTVPCTHYCSTCLKEFHSK